MQLGFKKVHPDAKIPTYAHEGDAGMDVCAVEDVTIPPLERRLVSTGLCADIPTGYEIQVRSRSGLALKQGIFVLNSPGTIDESYTGTIGVILMNLGKDAFSIKKGDRVAQLVVSPATRVTPVEVAEIKSTARGYAGFGSTGV